MSDSEDVCERQLRTPSPSEFLTNRLSDRYVVMEVTPDTINEMLDSQEMEGNEAVLLKRQLERGESSSSGHNEGEWIAVSNKGKKRREEKEKVNYEIYISHKEHLPKQFALARLFQELGINNISHVKYLTPFKIRIQFTDEESAIKLFECEGLKEKGWLLNKAMEVSYCYGVIKNIDLNVSEKELQDNIDCPNKIQLISIKRLNKRNRDEGGWCLSESVRLCFKGPTVPPFIFIWGMKVVVQPYVYQVSQCSNCWRLGHNRKMCPSKKIVCPKCGQNHENCDTKLFICINCKGNHMALDRTCSAFIKERRLRELMAESGCTYRKALTLYVPPVAPDISRTTLTTYTGEDHPQTQHVIVEETTPRSMPLYSEVVKTKAMVHQTDDSSTPKNTKGRKMLSSRTRQRGKKNTKEDWAAMDTEGKPEEMYDKAENSSDEEIQHTSKKSFSELLKRFKEIVFLRNLDFTEKCSQIFRLCFEWILSYVIGHISDWPYFKDVLEILFKFNGP